MEKKEVRKAALQMRDAILPADRKKWSYEIQEKVRQSLWYRQADIVLSYASFRSETDTSLLNEWILEDGKHLYLPRTYINKKTMEFYRVTDLSALESGYQGIREPAEGICLFRDEQPETRVLMLMPGVAFDEEGNRLGYGGGFYDRYLSAHGEKINGTMLLAFASQKAASVKAGQLDIRPDRIITNTIG